MAQVPSLLWSCLVIYFSFLACLLPRHHVAAQEDGSLETPPPSPSPTPSPWRCVNPDAPEADDGRVRRGSRTTVCLTVGPGSNWAEVVQYVRYVFRPTADEYSVYTIPNCEDMSRIVWQLLVWYSFVMVDVLLICRKKGVLAAVFGARLGLWIFHGAYWIGLCVVCS